MVWVNDNSTIQSGLTIMKYIMNGLFYEHKVKGNFDFNLCSIYYPPSIISSAISLY